MWNVKRNDTDELIKQKETHRLKRTNLWLPGGGMDMYTLLYLKWITNKDLLSSTGNSAQCDVAAWVGGESGEDGYTYMWQPGWEGVWGRWIHVYVAAWVGVSLGDMDTPICGSLGGRGVWGRWIHVYAESLHCSSESTTTPLIGYTAIQNVLGVKNVKMNEKNEKVKKKLLKWL